MTENVRMERSRHKMEGVSLRIDSAKSLTPAVKYVIEQFLDDTHYRSLRSNLADSWDNHQSLTAAMKLMEQYGVKLSQEQQAEIAGMDEIAMIEALVTKMPKQNREDFEHFFLQLQLIVSTAQRIRHGLEAGRPEEVEGALENADSTGVLPYILKMSLVQAGTEVSSLRRQHALWIRDSEERMSSLLKGQDDHRQVQRQLASAQLQLSKQMTSHNDKAKKLLLSLAGNNRSALIASSFSSWACLTKALRHEHMIRAEYEDRIHEAVQRLADYQKTQLDNVTGVLMRKAAANDAALVSACFYQMVADVEEAKHDAEMRSSVDDVQAKLARFKADQAENTKKVMTRMAQASDAGTENMCFQSWVHFLREYRKNKEFEDQVKKAEQEINSYMKNQTGSTTNVIQRMSAASDSGLLHTILEAWHMECQEKRHGNELEALLNGEDSKFKMFSQRNTENANEVMRKATVQLEHFCLLRCFNMWKMDSKVEALVRACSSKMEGRRGQLYQVQGLFRKFAVELERGLADPTPRDQLQLMRRHKSEPRLTKGEGPVILPDIHARPGSSARPGISGRNQSRDRKFRDRSGRDYPSGRDRSVRGYRSDRSGSLPALHRDSCLS